MKTNYTNIDTSNPKLKGRQIIGATLDTETNLVEVETDEGIVILKGKKFNMKIKHIDKHAGKVLKNGKWVLDTKLKKTYKTCSKCGKKKTSRCFSKDKQKSDGLYSSCNLCHRRWYREVPDKKLYNRKKQLRQKYGLTLEDYDEINKKQNGLCAICGKKNKTGWPLAVDHDHKTGKNRELLCAPCNVMLGTSYDNIEILKSAIIYLIKHHA